MRLSPVKISDLKSDILKLVRNTGEISRAELARTLKLSPSTAGIYVEHLKADGFLLETGKLMPESGPGRPSLLLKLNPEGGEFVGIDFEARRILAAAVDFADTPLRHAQTEISPGDTAAEVVRKIERTIRQVLPEKRGRLLAIGAGVPGIVNSADGVAVHYKYISKWKNILLAKRLREKFAVPVYLENNARSMALAELWFGQGQGARNFVCLGIRSGIGAGMVLNGQLYSGSRHGAGEFGRWRSPMLSERAKAWYENGSGKPVAPGPELQEIASVRAIQRALQKAIALGEKTILTKKNTDVTQQDVVSAVQCRDPLAMFVVAEAGKSLGWAIAQLSLLTDPEKIVIAGPLTQFDDTLMHPLRATMESILAPSESCIPEVVYSTMGEFSGALGAAALALQEWRPAR